MNNYVKAWLILVALVGVSKMCGGTTSKPEYDSDGNPVVTDDDCRNWQSCSRVKCKSFDMGCVCDCAYDTPPFAEFKYVKKQTNLSAKQGAAGAVAAESCEGRLR